jgi:DNA-directed RNA polymerase specialized sigma24 family protein
MSSKQIVRQAPYLRRYARALTGSQDRGDRLVQDAMEGLLRGEIVLDPSMPLRTALYGALIETWRTSHGGRAAADGGDGVGADQHLQHMSPDCRAALLLVAMEGFSVTEAGSILSIGPDEVNQRLTEADAELQQELATDVLIIEDEPIIALDLTRLVRELGHKVVGTAATRREAVDLAKSRRPGLVLADIRLADGSSGMDAAADILTSFDIPVIFITAFPEHLLTGEGPEPAFVVTKPFREETVKALIGQALFFHSPAQSPRGADMGGAELR